MRKIQFQNGLVFVVERRLVQHGDTQIFLGTVWLWHLQEGVHLSHSWDVVRNERLEFGVKFNLLRLVSLDVLEHLLDFCADRQVSVLRRIVGAGDFLLVVAVVVVTLTWLLCLHLLLSLGLGLSRLLAR